MIGKCLLKAHEIINGERRKSYGPPEESLDRVSQMWSAYLSIKLGAFHFINPADVAFMMILMKICREVGGEHDPDNLVDIAGYAGVAETCFDDEPQKEAPKFIFEGTLSPDVDLSPGYIQHRVCDSELCDG